MTPREFAEAFSGHRFETVYAALAGDVRWVLPGHPTLEGKDAVVAACEQTRAGLAEVTAEFLRFVCVADDRVAAVDAIGRYAGPDGSVSLVSSADVYELDEAGTVRIITSYTVELDPPA